MFKGHLNDLTASAEIKHFTLEELSFRVQIYVKSSWNDFEKYKSILLAKSKFINDPVLIVMLTTFE